MSRRLTCPDCAESEDLAGERGPNGIRITCGRCGASWPRDEERTCATCGGTRLQDRAQALTQYSRGTQLSIVGWRQVPLCETCDATMLQRSIAGKPVPNQYTPAAMTKRDPDEEGPVQTRILPG